MSLKDFLVVFIMLISSSAFSQEKEEIVQQRIEFISEQLETEQIDLTDVVQNLYYHIDNPINLNATNKEELSELNLLTDVQINNLRMHIERFGKLISIYELQSLKYWSMETIFMVLPFVKVDDKIDQLHVSFKEALKRGKFEWYLRYQRILENKKAYNPPNDSVLNNSNSYYHGNPDKYYTRLRFKYRTNLSFGVTAEKDAGEEFFKGSQKQGFDFYSAHAFYKGGKYLRAVALGDYQVQIGQGLNLWSGYAFGKTADAVNVKKSANPLKQYTSVNENRFLRGAAVDLGYKDFQLTLFGSYKKVDGSVNTIDTALMDLDDIQSGGAFVSSINLSGLHRTNSEISKKHTLTEMIYGGNLRYEKRNLHIGVAAVNWGYNKPFNKPIQAYNQFDFRGKNTTSISADYSYVVRNFHFFGEASYASHSNNFANIHGLLIALDAKATLSFVYRNYQRGYATFYNAAFAESGRTENASNEKGFYTGLSLNLSKAWSINSYFDLFEFPWMKYQVDAPSRGYEFLIQPKYRPNREFEIYFRFRQQIRQKNSRNSDGTVTALENVLQRNYRINMSYKVADGLKIKSRVAYVTINRPSNLAEDGILFTQDVIYQPKKLPFDISLRYALFETDSYDSRLYSFESNALYVYSIPAYYYQGSRAYAMIRLTLFRKLDLWVRYGVFLYNNRKTISSGPEEIKGNSKTDLTIQLRLKL